jgi:hypothetical protein
MGFLVKKQGSVSFGGNKTKLLQLGAKSRIPSSGSLLKAIKSFVKFANIVWSSRRLKTWGLSHINLLFQNTM